MGARFTSALFLLGIYSRAKYPLLATRSADQRDEGVTASIFSSLKGMRD